MLYHTFEKDDDLAYEIVGDEHDAWAGDWLMLPVIHHAVKSHIEWSDAHCWGVPGQMAVEGASYEEALPKWKAIMEEMEVGFRLAISVHTDLEEDPRCQRAFDLLAKYWRNIWT